MELYPIWYKGQPFVDCYVLIEVIETPDIMGRAYGFEQFPEVTEIDEEFPEFYNAEVRVFKIDTDRSEMTPINSAEELKEFYGGVHGRSERIRYWRTIKYLQACKPANSNK